MSAPQPPNPPWQGGQPQQWLGEPGQEQQGQPAPPEQNPALSQPGPTQVLGGPGQAPGADGVERTQVVRPEQQGDKTQMVPPGALPPQQPPYAPPPSASSPPGGFPPPSGGFGHPPPGYGQPPPGYGPPPPQAFGQQPPPGYGPPPGGFAQQPGLGHGPAFGGQGQNTQMIQMIILGAVAVFGLIGAVMMITLWSDLGSASRAVDQVCSGPFATSEICDQTTSGAGRGIFYTIVLLVASLGAIAGAVLLYLKKISYAHYVLLGCGGLMVLFSIIFGADGSFCCSAS
jgi:hypothetical protein